MLPFPILIILCYTEHMLQIKHLIQMVACAYREGLTPPFIWYMTPMVEDLVANLAIGAGEHPHILAYKLFGCDVMPISPTAPHRRGLFLAESDGYACVLLRASDMKPYLDNTRYFKGIRPRVF